MFMSAFLASKILAVWAPISFAQAFQYAATSFFPTGASVLKILKLYLQRSQRFNLFSYVRNMVFYQRTDPTTVCLGVIFEGKQFPNLGQLHAMPSAMPDKAKPLNIVIPV